MKLVLMGPPGAGKGTQTEFITRRLNIPAISTGSIFRDIVRGGSPLAPRVQEILKEGKLVPDELVIDIVKQRIGEKDCANGFILDGFPRTENQAVELDKFADIDCVLFIDVADEEIEKRIAGRRTCEKCSAVYGAGDDETRICRKCGGSLVIRDDDKPEVVHKRLAVYRDYTAPLIRYYKDKGILKTVSGVGAVEEISRRIADVLNINGGGCGRD